MEENTNYSIENAAAGSAGQGVPAETACVKPKKKPSAGKITALVLAVLTVAGASFAAGIFLPKKDASVAAPAAATDASPQETQTVETYIEQTEKTEPANIPSAENRGIPLHGGRYTVGEDIPAGKYLFMYKTTLSEDDYWSNDYLWIIYAGSEGSYETFSGARYDDRAGSVSYADACAGKSFYFNLHDGDSLLVDSDSGEWTY